MSAYQCPVCGFHGLERPHQLASGNASFEICECCTFQFGYDDDDQGFTFAQWREQWIARGMPWGGDGDEEPPPNWDPTAQLATLNDA